MIYYNLIISGSGIPEINTTYELADDLAVGYARVWKSTNGRYIVLHKVEIDAWIINTTAVEVETVYSLLNTDASGKGTGILDPWTAKGAWQIAEGNIGTLPVPSVANYQNPNIIIVVDLPIITEDENGNRIISTTTHITNMLTGQKRTETDVIKERVVYKDTSLIRYDTPSLLLGRVYRFSFIKDFVKLGYITDETDPEYDVERGVYKLEKILPYSEVMNSAIDIFANLYEPLGLSRAMYIHDEQLFSDIVFYKLIDPKDVAKVLYVPISFFDKVPDASINTYSSLVLTIELGVFSGSAMLMDMIKIIKNLMATRWGIDVITGLGTDHSKVNIATVDKHYLTTQDYKLLEDYRECVKKLADGRFECPEVPEEFQANFKDCSTELYDALFNSSQHGLVGENARLKAQVSAYEELLQNK